MAASKLIEDLTHVPNIIGALGLSIAGAQRAFDANYLDGLERTIKMSKMLLDPKDSAGNAVALSDEQQQILRDVVSALAPSKYQYTETTLTVKLDLAQSLDVNANVGLGIGLPAVSINAAFAVGYGFDYRAAAECRTVIHAIPPKDLTLTTLLNAAKDHAIDVALPENAKVDQEIFKQTAALVTALTGKTIKQPAAPANPPAATPTPGQ